MAGVGVAGAEPKRQADCVIDNQKRRPGNQEPQRIRQHHRGQRADTRALDVTLTVHDNEREVRH